MGVSEEMLKGTSRGGVSPLPMYGVPSKYDGFQHRPENKTIQVQLPAGSSVPSISIHTSVFRYKYMYIRGPDLPTTTPFFIAAEDISAPFDNASSC